MAEETTSTTSDPRLDAIINQYLLGKAAPPVVDPNTGPSSREGRGILSLLGEGLGGGAQYGSTQEREQGGLSALGAAGSRMLQASDWSVMPHTFGSILGQGLDAARGNLGHTQAVSAARQYAAQEQAHQAQQDQIARLKEALPYLQLQEEQRAAARQRELLKPGSTNTSIGAAGDYTVPAELLPAYKTAAEKYGVPVELLIAQHKQESNLNPGATGGAGEVGLGQILPATAKSPGFGMAGADPKALRDPAANIDFSARYLAARAKAAGADLRTPEGVTKALQAYNGGGDPDYVGHVLRYVPGAQKALAGGAPAPGQAGAPATPTPVGQNPNAKVQIPPAATTPAAPGQATMPPPEPPLLAGTAQTAGDVGAPTSGVIPPSPSGSDATVAEIEAGRASSPARTGAQPGAVVTAQAGGQQPPATQLPPIKAGDGLITHPGTYSEYRAREFVPPPATEDFNPNLTPAQQRAFASEAAAIEQRARAVSAMRKPDEKSVQEILAAREEIKAKVAMAAQEKAQKAALAITKYNEAQDNAIRPRYEKEVDAYKAAAQANLAHSQGLELARINAEETRTSKAAEQEGQYILDERKDMAKTRDAARQSIDQVHVLRALSDRAGTATSLESLTLPNGQTMRDLMVQNGLGSEATLAHLNAQQAYEAAASQMVMDLRKGVQMGSLSDRDLAAVQKLVPKGAATPEGRANILATIEQAHSRNRDYIDRVHQLWDQGKGLSWEKAKVEADKQMGDIVPQVPQEYNTMTPEQKVGWFKANAPPRTLLRTPDELNKDGKVVRRGHIILVPEAPE